MMVRRTGRGGSPPLPRDRALGSVKASMPASPCYFAWGCFRYLIPTVATHDSSGPAMTKPPLPRAFAPPLYHQVFAHPAMAFPQFDSYRHPFGPHPEEHRVSDVSRRMAAGDDRVSGHPSRRKPSPCGRRFAPQDEVGEPGNDRFRGTDLVARRVGKGALRAVPTTSHAREMVGAPSARARARSAGFAHPTATGQVR
jgi:hypothetical protein